MRTAPEEDADSPSTPWAKSGTNTTVPNMHVAPQKTPVAPVATIGVPLPIGHTGTSWNITASIPESKVLAAAHSIRNIAIEIGSVSLILVLVVVLLIARSIAKPIQHMAGQLSVGADNVITSGKNPFLAAGQDDEGTVPYVRYQQDL